MSWAVNVKPHCGHFYPWAIEDGSLFSRYCMGMHDFDCKRYAVVGIEKRHVNDSSMILILKNYRLKIDHDRALKTDAFTHRADMKESEGSTIYVECRVFDCKFDSFVLSRLAALAIDKRAAI